MLKSNTFFHEYWWKGLLSRKEVGGWGEEREFSAAAVAIRRVGQCQSDQALVGVPTRWIPPTKHSATPSDRFQHNLRGLLGYRGIQTSNSCQNFKKKKLALLAVGSHLSEGSRRSESLREAVEKWVEDELSICPGDKVSSSSMGTERAFYFWPFHLTLSSV